MNMLLLLLQLISLCYSQMILTDFNLSLHPALVAHKQLLSQESFVTFATPLARGEVPDGVNLVLTAPSVGKTFATQYNCLVKYDDDNSCRHVILTVLIPANTLVDETSSIQVFLATVASGGAPASKTVADATARLAALNFDANVTLNDNTVDYSFSLVAFIAQQPGLVKMRVAGELMVEFYVRDWLRRATSAPHAWLETEVVVRVYFGSSTDFVHVDFSIENTKTTLSASSQTQGFNLNKIDSGVVYTATLRAGAASYTTVANAKHHWAQRWRKGFLHPLPVEADSLFFVTHNARYISYTRALPTYDYGHRLPPTEAEIQHDYGWFMAQDRKPLTGNGMVLKAMHTTGEHDDLGIVPKWVAKYLFATHDYRLYEMMMHSGDVSGHFPIHWRNESNNDFFSIESDPKVTSNNGAYGRQIMHQTTASDEGGWWPDSAHQPSLVFLPYLLSAMKWYEDEMIYWPLWIVAKANPGDPGGVVPSSGSYRRQHKGILQETLRGNAWTIRQFFHATLFVSSSSSQNDAVKQRLVRHRDYTLAAWHSGALPLNPLGYFAFECGVPMSQHFYPDASSDVKVLSNPWQHEFLAAVLAHGVEQMSPSPPSELLALFKFVANWTVNRYHSKWANDWDRSYGTPYRAAQQSNSNYFYQTMSELWQHSFGGDSLKSKDGLGGSGPINPTACEYCYPWISRGALHILKAHSSLVADVDDPFNYISANLDYKKAEHKWSFAETLATSPYNNNSIVVPPPPPPTSADSRTRPPTPATAALSSSNASSPSSSSLSIGAIVGIVFAIVIVIVVVAALVFFGQRRRQNQAHMAYGSGSKSSSRRPSYQTSRRTSSQHRSRGTSRNASQTFKPLWTAVGGGGDHYTDLPQQQSSYLRR